MRTFSITEESKIGQSISAIPEDSLPVVEMFYGIEGEGSDIGDMRILFRVAGCRVKCRGCDSVHTWNAAAGEIKTLDVIKAELKSMIEETKVKTVAITGGEPMHYPKQMAELADYLKTLGVRSWLETSGWIIDHDCFKHFDFLSFDIKTPSAKDGSFDSEMVNVFMEEMKIISTYAKDMHIKLIVTDEADIQWILDNDIHGKLQPYLDGLLKQRLMITPACGKHSTPSDVRRRIELAMYAFRGLPYRLVAQQHPLLSMP